MANITIDLVGEEHLDTNCIGDGATFGQLTYPDDWTEDQINRAKRGYRCMQCHFAGEDTRALMRSADEATKTTIRAAVATAVADGGGEVTSDVVASGVQTAQAQLIADGVLVVDGGGRVTVAEP